MINGRAANRSETVRFVGSGRRLTPERLRAAEAELGVSLPEEYREFMLKHNGGDPEPAHFVYERRDGPRASGVQNFAPITSSRIDSLNLRGHNEMVGRYADEGSPVPDGDIAIGDNVPGDSILLSTKGRRRGQVWLKVWDDLANDPDVVDKPEDGLYRLAASFNKFLAMLCTTEEAERRVAESKPAAKGKRASNKKRK